MSLSSTRAWFHKYYVAMKYMWICIFLIFSLPLTLTGFNDVTILTWGRCHDLRCWIRILNIIKGQHLSLFHNKRQINIVAVYLFWNKTLLLLQTEQHVHCNTRRQLKYVYAFKLGNHSKKLRPTFIFRHLELL